MEGDLEEVDWIPRGVLTEVVQQMGCNCCWAIVAIECITARLKIKRPNEEFVRLAKQELVDCLYVKLPTTRKLKEDRCGCLEASVTKAFRYIAQFGISLEKDYPFLEKRGECNEDRRNPKNLVYIEGFMKIDDKDDRGILMALKQHPIAAAMDVYRDEFLTLKEKIYEGPSPNKPFIGKHAILIVAAGETDGIKYYKIKNSWGVGWGVDGFGKIGRDLITTACYPLI